MFQLNFGDLSGCEYNWSRQIWKSGPVDSVFHPKHTHTILGAVLIVFHSTTEKCFGRILMTFPGPGTTGAAKVENRAWMTRFSTWNISTLFGVQFLSFHVSTFEKNFGRILTTFLGSGNPEQSRSRQSWRSRADDLVLHQNTVWGAFLIVCLQYDWKMFRSNFNDFFGPEHHRSRQSWKSGQDDSVMHPKHTHTICGVVLIVSR